MLKLLVKVFGTSFFYGLNRKIHRLSNRLMGVGNHENLAISGESYAMKYVLGKYNPRVIFDIGAHDGDYIMELRKAGYIGLLYAFEPHPITFARLKNRFGNSDNTQLFPIAFSSEVGESKMYDRVDSTRPEGTHHASLHEGVLKDIHNINYIEYNITLDTIDGFCNKHRINTIDFLKIDTEGHEFNILTGAKNLLKNKKIKVIQFEFGQMNVVSRVFFKDFFDLFIQTHQIYRMLPNALIPITVYDPEVHEIFHYQNFLVVLKN